MVIIQYLLKIDKRLTLIIVYIGSIHILDMIDKRLKESIVAIIIELIVDIAREIS